MDSRTRRIRLATYLLMAFVLALSVGLTHGSAAAQEAPPAVETPPPTAPAPHGYSSPRATMETFLTSFYGDSGPDLDRAATCLDLSALSPAVRSLQGRELAGLLKRVLDRTRLVDLETMPDDPDGGPWVFERYDSGSVEISRGEGRRWLFSRDTVAALWRIHDEVLDREIVAGVEALVET